MTDVPEKRGRGRPKTGKALTPAEKQRAYRERHKTNFGNAITHNESEIERLLQKIDMLENALSKEVAARKKAELKSHKTVTKIDALDAPGTGIWTTQFRQAGQRGWKEGIALVDDEGNAWSFEAVKAFVKSMSKKLGRDRAVRDDGLIYEPKAPK